LQVVHQKCELPTSVLGYPSFVSQALCRGYWLAANTALIWLFSGVKINMPWIAPGDVFYLQGTYENGAIGYITGNTLAYKGGFWASSLNYGNGAGATPTSNGWVENTFSFAA
jgi:hypothetical protein